MGYTQLGLEERYQIYVLLHRGWSIAEVASWMRRARTTIYRELKRNRGGKGWRPRPPSKSKYVSLNLDI